MVVRLYPLGQQYFRKIIRQGKVYVDKTMYANQLITTQNTTFFLAPEGLENHYF